MLCRSSRSRGGSIPPLRHHGRVCRRSPRLKARLPSAGFVPQTQTAHKRACQHGARGRAHQFEITGTNPVAEMHKPFFFFLSFFLYITLHKCACLCAEIFMRAREHAPASCNTNKRRGRDGLRRIAHGWEQTKPRSIKDHRHTCMDKPSNVSH